MFDDLSHEEVVQAIDRAVEELFAAAGVSAPPVDAVVLAQRHLGLTIRPAGKQTQRRWTSRQACPSPEPTAERRQWTAAQQIGQHLKPTLVERLSGASEGAPLRGGDFLANLIAQRLLVPTCWFADDAAECGYDLLDLKQRYRTATHEVIAWRFLDLPAPCIITILDNAHITRRRSNAWLTRRRLEPVEQQCQRYVHEYSRPRIIQEGGWTVQGWPVHQSDWKREVLRSVVEMDE